MLIEQLPLTPVGASGNPLRNSGWTICAIFAGDIRDWRVLGGPAADTHGGDQWRGAGKKPCGRPDGAGARLITGGRQSQREWPMAWGWRLESRANCRHRHHRTGRLPSAAFQAWRHDCAILLKTLRTRRVNQKSQSGLTLLTWRHRHRGSSRRPPPPFFGRAPVQFGWRNLPANRRRSAKWRPAWRTFKRRSRHRHGQKVFERPQTPPAHLWRLPWAFQSDARRFARC